MSTKEQTLAREVASLTGRTYTDALREVRETPTLVTQGCVYQPLRLMSEGRTANISGDPATVIALARQIRQALKAFGSTVAIEVFVRPDEIDRDMVLRSMQGLEIDDPVIIVLANSSVEPLDPRLFFDVPRAADQQACEAGQRIVQRCDAPYDPAATIRPGTVIFAFDTDKRPVTLDLTPGRVVCVAGRPGSGKSVLSGIVFDQARRQGWRVMSVYDIGSDTDLTRTIVYADHRWVEDAMRSARSSADMGRQIRDLQQRSALVWIETLYVASFGENATVLMMSNRTTRLLVDDSDHGRDGAPIGAVLRVDDDIAHQWSRLKRVFR